MATTFEKIRSALRYAAKRNDWQTLDDLVEHLHTRDNAPAFYVGGDRVSAEAVRRLLRLMVELNLLSELQGGRVSVPAAAVASLDRDDLFARKIQSSVKSYLDNRELPLENLLRCMRGVRLPDVPDARTIFTKLYGKTPSSKRKLTEERLITILYLYACADGVKRVVRVHYVEK